MRTMRACGALALGALFVLGCEDRGDFSPPAAPRGVYTVTGDGEVFVHWLANTERDVAGYRIYEAPCAGGGGCPYDRVGSTTGIRFRVDGLVNGRTRYFAVAAYDYSGNESDLSYDVLFDTPRPEGFGRTLNNRFDTPLASGYDFSAFAARTWNDSLTDMYFAIQSGTSLMLVPDFNTDIQDAGYAASLDAVDYAPTTGWAPSGSVELIVGHCYIVWTRDDHYAKFRVTELRPAVPGVPAQVMFDWAYQVDPGNRELRARRLKDGRPGERRPIVSPG